eukprot:4756218-Pleurochrysis_carterae.AAC.1
MQCQWSEDNARPNQYERISYGLFWCHKRGIRGAHARHRQCGGQPRADALDWPLECARSAVLKVRLTF